MKKSFVILLSVLSILFLGDSSVKTPGTMADGGGDVAFSTPANGGAEDGIFTSATINSATAILFGTNCNFSIPTDDTIDSIRVGFKYKYVTVAMQQILVWIKSTGGDGSALGWDLPTTTNTWYRQTHTNATWNIVGGMIPSVINSPNFGVGIYFAGYDEDATISVDATEITVYYHAAAGPGMQRRIIGEPN